VSATGSAGSSRKNKRNHNRRSARGSTSRSHDDNGRGRKPIEPNALCPTHPQASHLEAALEVDASVSSLEANAGAKDAGANVSALDAAGVSPLEANAGAKDADANVSAREDANVSSLLQSGVVCMFHCKLIYCNYYHTLFYILF